jgi:virginiamycin B lyase
LFTVAALAAAVAAAVAAAAGPPSCEAGCASAFSPGAGAAPFGITSGPRGSVWFSANSAVDRIDQQADLASHPVPTPNAVVGWLTAGSGGVWFAERGSGKVGFVAADGAITEFSLPSPNAVPQGIVVAPNGDVYVTEQIANAIARLDPQTGNVIEYPVPTPNSSPLGLALGPDGALWFTERTGAKIGRMSLEGAFTEYALAPGSAPQRIASGPDGMLWFTELGANKLGRIGTDGTLTEFALAGGPVGITLGKDGQLYVVLFRARAVAQVDLNGAVSEEWSLPGALGPLQVATGFGLDLWITDNTANLVFRLTPYALGR